VSLAVHAAVPPTGRDYPAEGTGAEALAGDLRRHAPDLVLLSVTTQALADDMDVAALVKRTVPGARVAAKGAHMNVLDREVPERWPATCWTTPATRAPTPGSLRPP
jgi:hypothetical protein